MSMVGRLLRLLAGRTDSVHAGSAPRVHGGEDGSRIAAPERLPADEKPLSPGPPPPGDGHLRQHPRIVRHYQALTPLGQGGMGQVYKAKDTRLDRVVALKFIIPGSAHDPQAIQRLRLEARAACKLNHPNICTIHDIGEYESGTFIVMEFLEGESLRQRLAKGALAESYLLKLAIQAADGLAAAHDAGVIHRDIKPENLFIVGKELLKILDFGLAKLQSRGSDSDQTTRTGDDGLTDPGVAVGTLPYMSPEQARGEEVDSRSDLFSLGAVLYEMAARRAAFGGRTKADVHAAVLTEHPILPAAVEPRFRDAFQAIVDRTLEKQREFRYQHASDLAADLRRLQRDVADGRLPVRMVPPPPRRALVGLGTRIAGDLLRAAAVTAMALVTYRVVERSASGKYLEQFQMAVLQQDREHGPLDEGDFEAGGRQLPLVVDVSVLHPDKRRPTDRTMLDTVIDELARNGAGAIGIDLSFDNIEASDLRYLQKWRQLENVRIGIYRRAVERREAWLGRPEFADLAAGIAMPADNPQQAFAYTRRWSLKTPLAERDRADPRDCVASEARENCKDDLYQLPVALWLVAEKLRSASLEPSRRDPLDARLTKVVEDRRLERADRSAGSVLEFGTYAIDYSYLAEVKRDIIAITPDARGDTGSIAAQLVAQRSRIADRLVLVGDLEDTSDQRCYTPSMNPLPGVLVHACALATWNRAMSLQPSSSPGHRVAWGFVLMVAAMIVGLRAIHSSWPFLRQVPHEHLEMLVFGCASVAVVLGARWLALTSAFVWPKVFWVAAALAAFSLSEPLWRAFVTVLRIVHPAAAEPNSRVQGG